MTEANHQELILDQFTRQATVFSTAPSITDERALEMIVEAVRPGPEDTVLDVACGPGLVVCAFAPHVQHATGIDVTPAMLERARKLAAERGLSNVFWRQGDVYSLPFADGSFSIVTTRFSFHHFLDPAAVLREMVRVCAPQGSFYDLRSTVRSLLARSFPNQGDDVKIVEMFRASATDDRLGVPVQIDGDDIHFAYPVTILAAQRPAR